MTDVKRDQVLEFSEKGKRENEHFAICKHKLYIASAISIFVLVEK